MNDKQLLETSKFLSYVLRHEPQAIGLQLDAEGWADIGLLIEGAARQGRRLDRQSLEAVVQGNDKKRFSLSADGQRIRAVQGHSTKAVSLEYTAITPPESLYHGTATRFIESIRTQGLIAGERHHVHLSADPQTATAVGQRHGKPVVLRVQALAMHRQGFEFFQADNGVWLTRHVPVGFLVEEG